MNRIPVRVVKRITVLLYAYVRHVRERNILRRDSREAVALQIAGETNNLALGEERCQCNVSVCIVPVGL